MSEVNKNAANEQEETEKDIPETEIGYLALHIERVRTSEMKKLKERIAG